VSQDSGSLFAPTRRSKSKPFGALNEIGLFHVGPFSKILGFSQFCGSCRISTGFRGKSSAPEPIDRFSIVLSNPEAARVDIA
jgi:hypothetical protein